MRLSETRVQFQMKQWGRWERSHIQRQVLPDICVWRREPYRENTSFFCRTHLREEYLTLRLDLEHGTLVQRRSAISFSNSVMFHWWCVGTSTTVVRRQPN